jgi:hypothetical protein
VLTTLYNQSGEKRKMPCDTISETEVEFHQQTDPDLLKKALGALGFRTQQTQQGFTFTNDRTYENGRFENGKFGFVQRGTSANAIKRGYSEQVVRASAKRFGWELKEAKTENSQIKFNVRKKVM